jgi:prepilin-type processing-associated H-X9-DG protein
MTCVSESILLRKLAISVSLPLISLSASFAQDRSTPEATVRSFLSAFEQGDVRKAAVCVKGVKMSIQAQDVLGKEIKQNPVTFTVSNVKASITGSSATVTADATMKPLRESNELKVTTQLNLISENSVWLIVPDEARAKQQRPDMINAVAWVLTDATAFARANDAAHSATCLSNLKQIGLAALMFLQDHNETYKLKAATYKNSLNPYIKNPSVFKCPSDASASTSYAFNASLVGVYIGKVKHPELTVVMYEGKNGTLNFRHNGKAAIGFADGHVKLVDASEAKKLRWKP